MEKPTSRSGFEYRPIDEWIDLEKENDELKKAIQYYFDVLKDVQGRGWDKKPDHVLEKMLKVMRGLVQK